MGFKQREIWNKNRRLKRKCLLVLAITMMVLPVYDFIQVGEMKEANAATVSIFDKHSLDGTLNKIGDLSLSYKASGIANLNLLTSTSILFEMPEEFKQVMKTKSFQQSLTVEYEVPFISLAGIVIPKKGVINPSQIEIEGKKVYVKYKNTLSLNLLSKSGTYQFHLKAKIPEFPQSIGTSKKEFIFLASSTDNIKVELLKEKEAAQKKIIFTNKK